MQLSYNNILPILDPFYFYSCKCLFFAIETKPLLPTRSIMVLPLEQKCNFINIKTRKKKNVGIVVKEGTQVFVSVRQLCLAWL